MWAHRHPWFNPPAVKRRLSSNNDEDEDEDEDAVFSSPSFCSTSRRKRFRCNSLEHTLAHMTLGSALVATSEDVETFLPPLSVQDDRNVALQGLVDEQVDMEVEPTVVITDTPATAYDGWEGIESGRCDVKEMQISSVVLECLRKQSQCPSLLVPLPPQTSQALVLYRAPRPPSPKQMGLPCKDEPTRLSTLPAHESDVMEVE